MGLNYDWLPKKSLTQINSDSGRCYITPTGNKYQSVTTFLGKSNAKSIQQWRDRIGKDEATKISTRAANRGTRLHNLVESYLLGDTVDFKNDILIKDLYSRFLPVVNKIDNIRALEYPLYSDVMELAGTVDCAADYEGVPSVIDFKSSSKPKKIEYIENYFLQCCIYSLMIEELYSIKLNQLVVAIAVENEQPQIFIENRKDWFKPLVKRLKER